MQSAGQVKLKMSTLSMPPHTSLLFPVQAMRQSLALAPPAQNGEVDVGAAFPQKQLSPASTPASANPRWWHRQAHPSREISWLYLPPTKNGKQRLQKPPSEVQPALQCGALVFSLTQLPGAGGCAMQVVVPAAERITFKVRHHRNECTATDRRISIFVLWWTQHFANNKTYV